MPPLMTAKMLQQIPLVLYAVAIIVYGFGVRANDWRLGDLSLGFAIAGLAFDMRRLSGHGVSRVIQSHALWHDGPEDSPGGRDSP